MTRASKKNEAKQELARRLGCPVQNLLTRAELSKRQGTTVKALSVRLLAHPPFYSKGERSAVLYPLPWVEEHERDGKVTRPKGGYVEGAQAWPPPPPPPPAIDPMLRDQARSSLAKLADQDYARRVADGDWEGWDG